MRVKILCREFWYNVTLPSSIKSNPRLKLSSEIRDDRQPPYFMAALGLFNTLTSLSHFIMGF